MPYVVRSLVHDAGLKDSQSRFAFARILATAGANVAALIPALMANLLAQFQPSELVDFMNFIGLLIHKLQASLARLYHILQLIIVRAYLARHVRRAGPAYRSIECTYRRVAFAPAYGNRRPGDPNGY